MTIEILHQLPMQFHLTARRNATTAIIVPEIKVAMLGGVVPHMN